MGQKLNEDVSTQSTESTQKVILINFVPNEAKYTLSWQVKVDVRPRDDPSDVEVLSD